MSDPAEKVSTKKKILEKAIEIFALKGFESTNLTDICDALGITRRPVYYYFQDKYGLFSASYDKWEQDFSTEMERILGADKPIMEIYRDILRFCILFYKRYAPNFFVGICTNPVLEDIQKRYYALEGTFHRMEVELTRQAIARGELKKSTDPEMVVGILFAINDGLRLGLERQNTGLNPLDLDELISIQLAGIQQYWGLSS